MNHKWEPTDSSGHYMECSECGAAVALDPIPVGPELDVRDYILESDCPLPEERLT